VAYDRVKRTYIVIEYYKCQQFVDTPVKSVCGNIQHGIICFLKMVCGIGVRNCFIVYLG
jgi:hypothetical protein